MSKQPSNRPDPLKVPQEAQDGMRNAPGVVGPTSPPAGAPGTGPGTVQSQPNAVPSEQLPRTNPAVPESSPKR